MHNPSDEILVGASRDGDRRAFAELVERYRGLIVGVAYNGLGDFDRSEDIAQQTFVTAWKRNFDLADPARLAAWLCGIARNLVRNERRRTGSEPSATVDENMAAARVLSPEQQSIAREEAELLWSVLEKIPETFREPMILYYREQATTAEVAAALEISPDVVRQRLSRGRKLLEQRVAEFVETTLTKRKTSPDFVATVLLALPASSLPKAGGILATLGLKSLIGSGAILGPLIGLAGAVYGSKRSLDSATSATERRFMWRLIAMISLLVGALLATQTALTIWLPDWHAKMWIQGSLWGLYAVCLSATIVLGNRRLRIIKLEHGTDDERTEIRRAEARTVSASAAAWNLVGAIVGSVAWMIVLAGLQRDWIGLWLVLFLLAGVLGMFVPRVVGSKVAWQQRRASWQAVIVTLLGTVAIVAARWSAWSERLGI